VGRVCVVCGWGVVTWLRMCSVDNWARTLAIATRVMPLGNHTSTSRPRLWAHHGISTLKETVAKHGKQMGWQSDMRTTGERHCHGSSSSTLTSWCRRLDELVHLCLESFCHARDLVQLVQNSQLCFAHRNLRHAPPFAASTSSGHGQRSLLSCNCWEKPARCLQTLLGCSRWRPLGWSSECHQSVDHKVVARADVECSPEEMTRPQHTRVVTRLHSPNPHANSQLCAQTAGAAPLHAAGEARASMATATSSSGQPKIRIRIQICRASTTTPLNHTSTGKMAAAWARVRSDVAPKRQARPASSMFDVVMLFQVSVPCTRVCKIV
jgi:hypothetical protein